MKWTKLGRIFDPAAHPLPAGGAGFAQSPQALVFDDFVRVYFSTRSVDGSGKYLSHPAFVDFRKNLRDVIRVSDRPVLPLGGLGCFDEHGIFPMHVVRANGEILAYPTGWSRRVSVPVETAIGRAASRDGGLTFERTGPGPVLAAAPAEPFLVGDGFVKVVGGVFHMWYIFGTAWRRFSPDAPPDRTYKIGHATSPDGLRWAREEGRAIVADRLGPDECQALPTVARIGDRWHLFFCYRPSDDFRRNRERGYRIGHARSADLASWTRDDEDPALDLGAPGDWDSDMLCYPNVFELDGATWLLYNGNEFGRHGFGLARLDP